MHGACVNARKIYTTQCAKEEMHVMHYLMSEKLFTWIKFITNHIKHQTIILSQYDNFILKKYGKIIT